jgi:hypothetical protein
LVFFALCLLVLSSAWLPTSPLQWLIFQPTIIYVDLFN